MNRFFTKEFYRFFFGFAVIIGIAFGILIVTSALGPVDQDDNIANPTRPDDYDSR